MTLATALRARDVETVFICRELHGHLCDRIEEQGFPVHRLPAVGESEASDVRAVLDALGSFPDWLVFDHYMIDHRTESALRDRAARILVIDDLADRRHECDVLLDQNLVPSMRERYQGLVSPDCVELLGPRYALLQAGYARLHDETPVRAGQIHRLFVFFSGADVDNLTGMALRAILALRRPDILVDVAIAGSHPFAIEVHRLASESPGVVIHANLPTLGPLMARADLAIGACGTTSWERACVGLPSVVISIAENQRLVAEGLAAHGLARWLGHKNEVSEEMLSRELAELVAAGLDEKWSRQCASAVDGRGADRVCDILLLDRDPVLVARPVDARDEDLLLEWANDPVMRANSFSPDVIAAEVHHAWLRDRLNDFGGCRMFIIESRAGVPVGQVRFDLRGGVWEIDYSLASRFRGRGLARPMLSAALRAFGSSERGASVLGRVKAANVPSRRVFEAMGFERAIDESGFVYRLSI